MASSTLTLDPRVWRQLRHHAEQRRFFRSQARFQAVGAGRRSGKTVVAKRKLIIKALQYTATHDGKFVFAAPTRDHAKRLYWDDLRRMIPRSLIASVNRSELYVELITGTRVWVAGLDVPQRIEGDPLDGIVVDEVDETKKAAWSSSIRPALSTRGRPPGWAIFIGRPKGRKLLWEFRKEAMEAKKPGEWDWFHWKSSDIIDPEEDASARRTLDPRTYAQEYDADFVNFEGRVYYPFDANLHARERLPYFDDQDLIFTFDFNISPGTACVHQEQRYWGTNPKVAGEVTATIGEVWIKDDGYTPFVCNKLIADWGSHKGHVFVYGDATGGARGTAKVDGSDWVQVERILRKHFGGRLHMRVSQANPPERVRVNCVNSRLLSMDGKAHWLVDPTKAPHLIEDFEGVVSIEGGSGEIDDHKYPMLTHPSDGAGYYIERRHPLVVHTMSSEVF